MKERTSVKKLILFFAVFLFPLFLIMGFVFMIDPLYQFGKPKFGMSVILEDTVHQSPGVARNLDYDGVVLGSSMSENSPAKEFDERFGITTVKLSYTAASTMDYKRLMGQIFESGNRVKYVFLDVNDFQLFQAPDYSYIERPEYLYNGSLFGKHKYLLSYDCLSMAVDRMIDGITHTSTNMDTAYYWTDNPVYSKDFMLDHYSYYYDNYVSWLENGCNSQGVTDEIKEHVAGNIENISYYVERHPETTFMIYYPPYSILYWCNVNAMGKMEEKIYGYKACARELLKYDNVRFFSFQPNKLLIENLDNYRDDCHYGPWTNSDICKWLSNGEYEITPDNLDEVYCEIEEYARNYDYISLWK